MLEPLETDSWQAFQLTTDALRNIDAWSHRRTDLFLLVDAKQKLETAKTEDPNFLRAEFYGAVVDDLLGNSQDSVETLNSLLTRDPAFKLEAEYNLAVSYYHLYTRPNMEQAVKLFEHVVNSATDPVLALLARAGLARSLSMMVHHLRKGGDREQTENYFRRAVQEGDAVLRNIRESKPKLNAAAVIEIEWRVINACGVAFMFHSDTLSDPAGRREELDRALISFRLAEERSPDNWEIVCNPGSAHMRLGYVCYRLQLKAESEEHYQQAERVLKDVLDRLRPNYGFAFYELGRLYRLQGRRDEALEWFEKSKRIPAIKRDVSDKSVDEEIARTHRGDQAFP